MILKDHRAVIDLFVKGDVSVLTALCFIMTNALIQKNVLSLVGKSVSLI